MTPLDNGLSRLRHARADRSLDGLEAAVLAKMAAADRQADVFRGHGLQVQLAVSCCALLIGLAMAQFMAGGGATVRSETVVLSDDSGLAPSISLEGGA